MLYLLNFTQGNGVFMQRAAVKALPGKNLVFKWPEAQIAFMSLVPEATYSPVFPDRATRELVNG